MQTQWQSLGEQRNRSWDANRKRIDAKTLFSFSRSLLLGSADLSEIASIIPTSRRRVVPPSIRFFFLSFLFVPLLHPFQFRIVAHSFSRDRCSLYFSNSFLIGRDEGGIATKSLRGTKRERDAKKDVKNSRE